MDQETAAPIRSTGRAIGGDRLRSLAAQVPRVVGLADRLAASIRRVAIGGGISALVICWLLVWRQLESATWRGFASALMLIVLLAPVAILLVFERALRDLRELPERLRALPGLAASQQAELARLAGEIRAEQRSRTGASLGAIWTLARTLWPFWEVLTGVLPTARLLLPPFSLLAVLAVVACAIEIVIAVIAVLIYLAF